MNLDFPIGRRRFLDLLNAVLERGSGLTFLAPGFSMSPFIKDGDLVTVRPCCPSGPRLGDVVVYRPPGSDRLIIHRMVGRKGSFYLVKGDGAYQHEVFPASDHVLARVTRVKRKGRRVLWGFGPDRYVIAVLSRWGLLRPLVNVLRNTRKRIGIALRPGARNSAATVKERESHPAVDQPSCPLQPTIYRCHSLSYSKPTESGRVSGFVPAP